MTDPDIALISKADRLCSQDNQEHYCHDNEITVSIISLLALAIHTNFKGYSVINYS